MHEQLEENCRQGKYKAKNSEEILHTLYSLDLALID